MKILSAAQIRKWDEYTIRHEPISSIDLMERAATMCTQWLLEHNLTTSIKIFCGKGNNGGDGLAIARQLAEKNIPCEIFVLGSETTGSLEFETNLERLENYSINKKVISSLGDFPSILPGEVVVDCLFGSGLNRPLDGLPAELVQHINDSNACVISIDIPSGLFADQSSLSYRVIKANYTLTFEALKFCFLFPENEDYFGEVCILKISLDPEFMKTIDISYELIERELVKTLYKPRKKFSHKGTFGHTLIIAGEHGKMGAAVLCTNACFRSGAGLVSAMIPPAEFVVMQTSVPEAMAISKEEISTIEWTRYASIALGPGLGSSESTPEVINTIISNYRKPMVIDADALNILSQNQAVLNELQHDSILTPHPKEFERLFGKTSNSFERMKIAKQQAEQLKVYIIVKGSYSLLACPDGEVYFNSTGNPGMATGGSGDVLTGILAGLLSQGYTSKHACILGVYLHGLAGDLAAQSLSQEALISGDIINHLGKAFLIISSR